MELENLEQKTNDTGTLVEAFKFPNDGQVFYVMVEGGASRGNHYHLRKTEHFVVVGGSAVMTVKDREEGTVMKVETSGYKPMTISVYPNHTHSITAGPQGCVFLVWCDEIYNEKDADTFPEEI